MSSSLSAASMGRSGTPNNGNANIQIIMEAERSAKAIIEEARVYRHTRVKQAREAALEEVSALKQRLEQEYLEREAKVNAEMDEAGKEVQRREVEELERVRLGVGKGWEETTRVLTDSVMKFD